MSWWEALVMGIVQGLTEFFPVSSSGHLVMTERVLGLELPGLGFEVAVHVATLISVLVVYRVRIIVLLRGLVGLHEESSWPYFWKLVIASIPAAFVGILFEDWFHARFDDPSFAGTMLLVTGCFVWSSRWATGNKSFGVLEAVPLAVAAAISLVAETVAPFLVVLATETLIMGLGRVTAPRESNRPVGWSDAAFMGVAQSVSILPGISRSGGTVLTGLWRRVDPVIAAEFSFLMSIPAILGAAVLSLPDLASEDVTIGAVPLAAGFIGAAVAGVLAIKFFVALLRKQNFHSFAWYCWAVGALFLVYVRSGG